MTLRLRYWTVSLVLAAAVGATTMLAVTLGAEPFALYLAHSLGSHSNETILTPALVGDLARWIGIAAFLGCLGIAMDVSRAARRRRW